jgi:hypothetical protein
MLWHVAFGFQFQIGSVRNTGTMAVAALVYGNKVIRDCCEARRDLRERLWNLCVETAGLLGKNS